MKLQFLITKNFINILLIAFVLIPTYLDAQLMEGSKKKFTEADTLRGMLRPERTCFDVTFYELDITLDTLNRSISGSNKIFFKSINDFNKIQIDLFENMVIDKIVFQSKELKFTRKFNAVFIDFPDYIKKNENHGIEVFYHGKPIIAKRAPWDGGFTWTYDKKGNLWVGVSCEGIGASLWWPNKDHLSDEPDSMRITCTVPNNLMFVGNGGMELATRNQNGTVSYTWKVSYPINNYNVTLNIGRYSEMFDEYDASDGSTLQIAYYVLEGNEEKAKMHFIQVKPMLACYEKFLGKYPFWDDGYALVETPYLGMEHQGAIAYGNKYRTGYNGMDYSGIGLKFDYIIIHETGHEWWGNSVSCSDIADLWIHEGFCTYSEAIYVECMHGIDTALLYVNAKKKQIGNDAPIIGAYNVNEEGDGDMYNKGMLMLNTLRFIVNDDKIWWSLIKSVSDTTFKIKNTNTEEVIDYFCNYTGINLKPVFIQYLYYKDIPELEYSFKKKKKNWIIKAKWNTNVSDFKMPVYIGGNYGQPGFKILPTSNLQEFTVPIGKSKKPLIQEELGYFKTKISTL